MQELSRPHRSNSKEQLSEVSPLDMTFPLFTHLLQRARLSTFTGQSPGTPEVGYTDQAHDSNMESEIRGQLVQSHLLFSAITS